MWLIDASTARPVASPIQHLRDIGRVPFSPDGRTIATSGSRVSLTTASGTNASAQLWDIISGKPTGEPRGHDSRVSALAFSPDGQILVSLNAAETARLWDAATGLLVAPRLTELQRVTAVGFTPDGGSLVTTGSAYGHKMGTSETGLAPMPPAAYLWPAAKPLAGDPERIFEYIRVLTSSDFDSADAIRPLDPKSWREHWRQLEELGGPPRPTSKSSLRRQPEPF